MGVSTNTFWKYMLLTFACLISAINVLFITYGVVAIGAAGSVAGANCTAMLGLFIIIHSFIGGLAAVRRSHILTRIFFVCSVISIILETLFLMVFVIMKNSLLEATGTRLEKLWEKELETPGSMDHVQMKYSCCGKDSPQDYLKDNNDVLPKSCCLNQDCSDDDNIFAKGCVDAATTFFDDHSDKIVLVLVGLIGLQVFGAISAYYLDNTSKRSIAKRERIVINQN